MDDVDVALCLEVRRLWMMLMLHCVWKLDSYGCDVDVALCSGS